MPCITSDAETMSFLYCFTLYWKCTFLYLNKINQSIKNHCHNSISLKKIGDSFTESFFLFNQNDLQK